MTSAERLTDLGYGAGWRLVRALPDRVARVLFDTGADIAARRNGGPQQLRRNLARVLGVAPEHVPDDLIRRSMRSYARYWREAFRLPSMDLDATAAAIDSSSAWTKRSSCGYEMVSGGSTRRVRALM